MKSVYARMDEWRPYVLSILRIVAPLLFLEHGLSKLFDFPVPGPSLQGLLILAAFLESIGALVLLVGVYTRIVAFILSGEMACAYFMAHAPRACCNSRATASATSFTWAGCNLVVPLPK